MSPKMFAVLAVCLSQTSLASANDVDTITGDWRTVRHGADVRIEDCGDGTPCGYLVSVSVDTRGDATHDARNKNPKMRARPLQNLPILWGYQKSERGWRSGKLYNPETGQTFRSHLKIVSPNKLKVKGCLGPFCREQIWTRLSHAGGNQTGASHD